MLPVWYARWKRSTRSSASSSSRLPSRVGICEIFDTDRDAAARGVGEAELLQAIEELHRRRRDRPCGSDSKTSSDSAFFFMSRFL